MAKQLATLTVNHTPVYAQDDYLFPQAMTEAMGLSWEGQRQRIDRSAWSEGWTSVIQVQVPGDIQSRERFAMHQRIVPMWIASIDTSRVNPDARPTVEAWQKEIAEVLAEHYYPTKPKQVVKTPARYRNGLPSDKFIKDMRQLGAVEVPTKYGAIVFSDTVYAATSLVKGIVDDQFATKEQHIQKAVEETRANRDACANSALRVQGIIPPAPPAVSVPFEGEPEQFTTSPMFKSKGD